MEQVKIYYNDEEGNVVIWNERWGKVFKIFEVGFRCNANFSLVIGEDRGNLIVGLYLSELEAIGNFWGVECLYHIHCSNYIRDFECGGVLDLVGYVEVTDDLDYFWKCVVSDLVMTQFIRVWRGGLNPKLDVVGRLFENYERMIYFSRMQRGMHEIVPALKQWRVTELDRFDRMLKGWGEVMGWG